MLFFYSTQTVSTSQTSELLYFLKNRVAKSISLLYTFGEFLAKSLKITHLNLLLRTEKVFFFIMLYYSLIYPFLTYGIQVWGFTNLIYLKPVTTLQKRVVRIMTFSDPRSHSEPFAEVSQTPKIL